MYSYKEDVDTCTIYLKEKIIDLLHEARIDVLASFASDVIDVIKDMREQEERQAKLYDQEPSTEMLDCLDDLRYAIEDIQWRMGERIRNERY